MTNKSFVLSIYPSAFCQQADASLDDRIAFVVYSDMEVLRVLGWSNSSSTLAWKKAASFLHKEMLAKFKKK